MSKLTKGTIQSWLPVIIIVILIGGGIFAWQSLKGPKEMKAPVVGEQEEEVIPPVAGEQEEEKVPEEATTPEDETANWKTYRNEEYGFEVKYPADLDVSIFEPGDPSALLGVKIVNEDLVALSFIFIYPTTLQNGNKTFQEKRQYFSQLDPEEKVEIKDFNINGRPAMQVSYLHRVLGEETAKWYETPINLLFTFNDRYLYSLDCARDKLICNQILSTFRFIE